MWSAPSSSGGAPPPCIAALFYRLAGDNLSESSANYQPLPDKTGTENSPEVAPTPLGPAPPALHRQKKRI